MISYEKHILDNGLTLLLHEDHETPLVTVNTLYNVGARNEDPNRTGFAHLFEHLMFGGTVNVPDFDAVVSSVGGESNASTNNDFTNYYVTAPAEHIETLLSLEADRMAGLDFSERPLSVQRKVVTEEYNQRFVNQPYGDKWLILRPLCYETHPYRWSTIGADIRHVQEATVEDERHFFNAHYYPANAIVAIAGNIKCAEALRMAQDTLGAVPNVKQRATTVLPEEPEPAGQHRLTVERNVPADMLIMAFLMCDRLHPDFAAYDLISDVLSNGQSSRMFDHLVKQKALFSEVNAYVTGDRDKGLFVVDGRLQPDVSLEVAEAAVWDELHAMQSDRVSDYELAKVVNKYEATFAFSQYKAADRASALCYYDWLGPTEWVNIEPQIYRKVKPEDLQRVASQCFLPHRANVVYYKSATQ